MRHSFRLILVALAVLALIADAFGDEKYPSRPIRVIVPATPGGPVDTAARVVEPALSAALGESLVLLNKPGASGTIGMQDLATAEPDGYTIGQGVNSIFTVTRVSGTKVPFKLDDFTLLGNYAVDVSVLAVHPESPWKTFDELVDFVKANPGKLTYASAGVGTVSAMSMEALRQHFKLDITAVPFQGGAQLTTAILGEHIDLGMVPYTTGASMFRAHQLRALITTASKRLSQLPDIPTLAEKGLTFNGLNLTMGLYAPHGLTDQVRNALTEAARKAAMDPEAIKKIEEIGLLPSYEDPNVARQRLDVEYNDIFKLKKDLEK